MSKELELEDNYPVYAGYAYVVDGKVISSNIQGDVGRLKRHMNAKSVKNCDLFGRAKEQEKTEVPPASR